MIQRTDAVTIERLSLTLLRLPSLLNLSQLIGQYLALRKSFRSGDESTRDPNMIGLVSLKCSVKDIALEAARDASYMCTRIHGDAPEVRERERESVCVCV